MDKSQEKVVNVLIKRGKELLEQPFKRIEFASVPEADDLLNNLKEYPHAFVLACVMDRQIKAERAWLIPYEISKEIGGFEFSRLLKLNLEQLKEIFKRKGLHRFNDTMAENFYLAVQRIHVDYQDDASKIWANNPRSAAVVKRFLELKGVGVNERQNRVRS